MCSYPFDEQVATSMVLTTVQARQSVIHRPRLSLPVGMKKIQVGDTEYDICLEKIPYLQAFQVRADQLNATQTPIHKGDIPFIDIINEAVQHGFRRFFHLMPAEAADYNTLCETLDYLAIDVLGRRDLADVIRDLKRKLLHSADAANLAHDSAFRLVYLFVLGDIEKRGPERDVAYEATLFTVSCDYFDMEAQTVLRKVFDNRFVVSRRQRLSMLRPAKKSGHAT